MPKIFIKGCKMRVIEYGTAQGQFDDMAEIMASVRSYLKTLFAA